MRINVNLDEVESGFEPLPAGNYPVRISKVEQRHGKEAPYLAWEFTITEGEYQGRKLFTNTSLAPQSLWNLKRLLVAAGFEWEDDGFDTEDTLGCELEVAVSQETYENRVRNRVDDFIPLS